MHLVELIAQARLRLRADERGFTLIEVMVAAFVLVAGLVAAVGVFNDSRDLSATGERHEIAVMQAEQALEEMRGLPFKNLLLTDGAVDPSGGDRVLAGGSEFQVKPDLAERLVYPATEGVPATEAWVRPLSSVQIGTDAAPLELTIHRFVTWRDEECRLLDLGGLSSQLPSDLGAIQGPIGTVINSITGALLQLLNPTLGNITGQLRNRLENLNPRLAGLAGALAGLSELDLCDADLTVLADAQKLSRLTPQLPVLGTAISTLQSALNLCLPLLCNQTQVQNAVNQTNAQLNCMFNSTGSSGDTAYLNGLIAGVDNLANDLGDTDRNTKRITVAVVVEPRPGVGPFEPVWASSVVRNPQAGLLTQGGGSCS